MKTSELTGVALDWAVFEVEFGTIAFEFTPQYRPSTDWSQGGPIIEREGVCLKRHAAWWTAYIEGNNLAQGTTPLIAAMRCYVASKIGGEIELPEELRRLSALEQGGQDE